LIQPTTTPAPLGAGQPKEKPMSKKTATPQTSTERNRRWKAKHGSKQLNVYLPPELSKALGEKSASLSRSKRAQVTHLIRVFVGEAQPNP